MCQKCEQNVFCALLKLSNNATLSKNVIVRWFCIFYVLQDAGTDDR